MVTIVDNLDSLSLQEPIFQDVKYYISGDVCEKVCFNHIYQEIMIKHYFKLTIIYFFIQ